MKIKLLTEAKKAAKNSYSPYSKFPVGAAVLCEDGTIISGSNQESNSFGLTVCGERVALQNAMSQGKKPVELAVTCPEALDAPLNFRMPCGACRQVMSELMPSDAFVHIDEENSFTVGELLPYAFSLEV